MRSALVSILSSALPLLGVTGVAAGAEPAPTTASARLEIQAGADCSTREELEARVAARSRRIHFDEAATGPSVRAIITATPHGGAVGELTIAQPDGKTASRRLTAPSCAEATDAIALIIALTLDPTSVAARPSSGPARPASTAAPAPMPSTAAPSPAPAEAERASPAGRPQTGPEVEARESNDRARTERATTERPQAEPAKASQENREADLAPQPSPPVAEQLRLRAGVGGSAIFGQTPDVLPGFAVYVMGALDREALWSPAVALWGTYASQGGVVEAAGTAAFTFEALGLDACPIRVGISPFEARACASGLVGRISANGSETYSPASATHLYAAAGGALLFSVHLGWILELSGRLGLAASLTRYSFAFSPTVFHETAASLLTMDLGIGVRFP